MGAERNGTVAGFLRTSWPGTRIDIFVSFRHRWGILVLPGGVPLDAALFVIDSTSIDNPFSRPSGILLHS